MWHREIPQVSAWTSNIIDGIWRELSFTDESNTYSMRTKSNLAQSLTITTIKVPETKQSFHLKQCDI